MRILLTGATGYIGSQLLPRLLKEGHEVYPLVRYPKVLRVPPQYLDKVHVIEGDLLESATLEKIPNEVDVAYYLVHSMSASVTNFDQLEAISAENFQKRISRTNAKQIIYLSGLTNEEKLSKHFASRKNVDRILREGSVPVTTLMAGIIIGANSASYQIMRDLVNKLPVMVAPKWINNLTQPIALSDVLDYLVLVLAHPKCAGVALEIGGPDVLSYKELLLRFAKVQKLKRWIFTVPLLTPWLSSLWLYFVTSASFPLAQSLVESLKNNAVCKEHRIQELFSKRLLTFEEAVRAALRGR